MLKRPITYVDYNEPPQTHTEDFYFNLNKAELLKLEIGSKEALTDALTRWMKEDDNVELFDFFKSFIKMSYGVRSADGKSFDKEDEDGKSLGAAFLKTAAYDTLFAELCVNANAAGDFLLAVIPTDLGEMAKNAETQAKIAKEMGITPDQSAILAAVTTKDPTSAPTTAELAADIAAKQVATPEQEV